MFYCLDQNYPHVCVFNEDRDDFGMDFEHLAFCGVQLEDNDEDNDEDN